MRTDSFGDGQERQVRQLLARSAIYRALAFALSYPTEECFQAFRQGWEEAKTFLEALDEDAFFVQEMDEVVKTSSRDKLEADYVRVFTHIYAPDAQPCETAYTAENLFQLTDHLSRLMRFYEAFGVQPHKERPDHISVELQFMGFLIAREARELLNGDAEHSEVCRNAGKMFFLRHLKKYAVVFARTIREKGEGTYLSKISDVLERWILAEARRLDEFEGSGGRSIQALRRLRVLQEGSEVMI